MGKNRVFFPVRALDLWIGEGKVELSADELTIKGGEDRRYRILEAARVVAEVSGAPDANELVGKVKTRQFLLELGAELLETSMLLGENAYEVVPGFLGSPVGTFDDHRKATEGRRGVNPEPVSDEDLIAQFLLPHS